MKLLVSENAKNLTEESKTIEIEMLVSELEKELEKINPLITNENVGNIQLLSRSEKEGLEAAFGAYEEETKDIYICIEPLLKYKFYPEKAVERAKITLYHELGHAVDKDLEKIGQEQDMLMDLGVVYGGISKIEGMVIEKVSSLTMIREKNAMENGITFAGIHKEEFIEDNLRNLKAYERSNKGTYRKILEELKNEFAEFQPLDTRKYNIIFENKNNNKEITEFIEDYIYDGEEKNISFIETKEIRAMGQKMNDLKITVDEEYITMEFYDNKKGRDIKSIEEAISRLEELPKIKEIRTEKIENKERLLESITKHMKEHNQEILIEAIKEKDERVVQYALLYNTEITKEHMMTAYEQYQESTKLEEEPKNIKRKKNIYEKLKGHLINETMNDISAGKTEKAKEGIEKFPELEKEERKEFKLAILENEKQNGKEFTKEMMVQLSQEKTVKIQKEKAVEMEL